MPKIWCLEELAALVSIRILAYIKEKCSHQKFMPTENSLIMKCAFWRKLGCMQPCCRTPKKVSNHHWPLVQSESPLVIGLEFSDYIVHFCSTSVPWEKFKHASKTIKHMKQYQHFTEALFIAFLGFLFMNSALIMLVSKFIIFTVNSVINLITDEQ